MQCRVESGFAVQGGTPERQGGSENNTARKSGPVFIIKEEHFGGSLVMPSLRGMDALSPASHLGLSPGKGPMPPLLETRYPVRCCCEKLVPSRVGLCLNFSKAYPEAAISQLSF